MSADVEQTLGAACDAALAELYTEALGLQGSARDEVLNDWGEYQPLPPPSNTDSSEAQQQDTPPEEAQEPPAQPSQGAAQGAGAQEAATSRQSEPELHQSASPRPSISTAQEDSSTGPDMATRRSVGSYSEMHSLRRSTRQSRDAVPVAAPAAEKPQAAVRQPAPPSDVRLEQLLPSMQPTDGMKTPPAMYLNDKLLDEIDQQEAGLTAELSAAAQEADLSLLREERAMDRALREAGMHPDDQPDSRVATATAAAPATSGSATGSVPELTLKDIPEDVRGAPPASADASAGAPPAQSNAGLAYSGSFSLQPLPQADSGEVTARANAAGTPLSDVQKVLPLSSDSGVAVAKARSEPATSDPVAMQLYLDSPNILPRKEQSQHAQHAQHGQPALAENTMQTAPGPIDDGGDGNGYLTSNELDYPRLTPPDYSQEVQSFHESEKQRSKSIAEQLARLQEESRMLQEKSRALQERAVAIEREAGIHVSAAPQQARQAPWRSLPQVPVAPEAAPPPVSTARSARSTKQLPAAAVPPPQPPAQAPIQQTPEETPSRATTGKPAPLTWELPQRKSAAHKGTAAGAGKQAAPAQAAAPSPPIPGSTPPGPIPSQSPEPTVPYSHTLASFTLRASEDPPLARQGSSTSTIEPLLPRWADQLASCETSPLHSPEHYRRYHSPLKTHPSPERKKRLQQQQQQEKEQQQQQQAQSSQPYQHPQQQSYSQAYDAAPVQQHVQQPYPTSHAQQSKHAQHGQVQAQHQGDPSRAKSGKKVGTKSAHVGAQHAQHGTEHAAQHAGHSLAAESSGVDYSVGPKPRRFLPEVRLPLTLQPQQPQPQLQPLAGQPQQPTAGHNATYPQAAARSVGFAPEVAYAPAHAGMWPGAAAPHAYPPGLHHMGLGAHAHGHAPGMAAHLPGMPHGYAPMWPMAGPAMYPPAQPPPLMAEHSSDSVMSHGYLNKPLPHKPAAGGLPSAKRTVKSGRVRNGAHAPTKHAAGAAQGASTEAPPMPHLQQMRAAAAVANGDPGFHLPQLPMPGHAPYQQMPGYGAMPAPGMPPAYGAANYKPYSHIGVWPGGMVPTQPHVPVAMPPGALHSGVPGKAPGQISPRGEHAPPRAAAAAPGKLAHSGGGAAPAVPSLPPYDPATAGAYGAYPSPMALQQDWMVGAGAYGPPVIVGQGLAKAPAAAGYPHAYAAQIVQRAHEIEQGQQMRFQQVEGDVVSRIDRQQQKIAAGAGGPPKWRKY